MRNRYGMMTLVLHRYRYLLLAGPLECRERKTMENDRLLTCVQCTRMFMFTISEQKFFKIKGLANEPKRCPNCRLTARITRVGGDATAISTVLCADCGCETSVPFQPKGHRPIYCSTCLYSRRESSSGPMGPPSPVPAG
jgi:CxxC-x17-CxxC domain-containing protein